jgi:very-short-patch-repair endonuclease
VKEENVQPDAAIARLAARQHGVVTFEQLVAAGIGKNAIAYRVSKGHLHRIYRGVYAVGHTGLSSEGRWLAAVLACGSAAVLSHGSAAALWRLLRPLSGPIDVSVPTRGGRQRRAGLRVHRTASLLAAPGSIALRDRIPVTSVVRTISDLQGSVAPRLVRRATRQAEILGLLGGIDLETDGTRSDLERDFLKLCRVHGLPTPEVNVRLGRWTVDFLWPREKVAVETDSYRYHRGSVAFEDDHARDLDLRQRGCEVRRFTYRQILNEPERVAGDLRDVLCRAS